MNYTAEKITYLKAGDCPICLGERKDCRSTGELIHCYSHNEPPAAYEHKGLSAIGASLYAPIRDNSKPFDRIAHQARLDKQARQKEQALNTLPSLEWRDRTIKSYPQKITVAQNADLLRRGLTQAEINFAISNHWIFGLQGGYGISAYDPISKLLVGAQRANDDRTKKYTWGVFTGKNKLRETGENPLFVWVSPSFDDSLPYEIKYSEGALKPLVRALQEWRTNQQIIVIGAAGGIFGNKALERVLSAFPNATKHTLLCDANSQNAKKLNIHRAYSNLAESIPSVQFADWGQWKDGLDCDETFGTDAFNGYELRSLKDWQLGNWIGNKQNALKTNWENSKTYTPDVTFNSEFVIVEHFPVPEADNVLICLRSAMGTGKTTGMIKHVKALGDRYGSLLGGSRNSLLRQTEAKWGFEHLNDIADSKDILATRRSAKALGIETASLADQKMMDRMSKLACCLDSFIKWEPHYFDGRILILDEADSVVLHALLSGTLGQNRDAILELFTQCCQRSSIIYLLSATLTDSVVSYIHDLRANPSTQVIKYENTYVKPLTLNFVEDLHEEDFVLSSRDVLRHQILNCEDCQFVVSDSQAELEALDRVLSLQMKKCTDGTFRLLRVLRVDSKTAETEIVKRFVIDPDETIKEEGIDVVLLSPTGNSGLDISIINHFKKQFCLYFGVLDVDGFVQLIGRPRDQNIERFISCPDSVKFQDEEIQQLPAEIIKDLNDYLIDFGAMAAAGLDPELALNQYIEKLKQLSQDRHLKEFARIKSNQTFEKNNLKQCLRDRLTQLGHICNSVYLDAESDDRVAEAKEENRLEDSQKLQESQDIDLKTAEHYQCSDKVTYKHKLQAEKAFFKARFEGIAATPLWHPEFIKFIRFDDRQFAKQAELRYLFENPHVALAKSRDKLSDLTLKSKTYIPDVRADLVKVTALLEIGIGKLINYAGRDLHDGHELILEICRLSSTKKNTLRLKRKQGRLTNIEHVGRLADMVGYKFRSSGRDRQYYIIDALKSDLDKQFKAGSFDIFYACITQKFESYLNRWNEVLNERNNKNFLSCQNAETAAVQELEAHTCFSGIYINNTDQVRSQNTEKTPPENIEIGTANTMDKQAILPIQVSESNVVERLPVAKNVKAGDLVVVDGLDSAFKYVVKSISGAKVMLKDIRDIYLPIYRHLDQLRLCG